MSWFLEGKEIKWCGEEGRFFTENEFEQIKSAYNSALIAKDKIEDQVDKLQERIDKLTEINIALRMTRGGAPAPEGRGDPGPKGDQSGESLRRLTEANRPATQIASPMGQSEEEIAERMKQRRTPSGGRVYE